MKVAKFLVKRIFIMAFTVLIVSYLVFMLLRVAGQDPVNVLLGDKQKVSEDVRASLREQYHLNESLNKQYFRWLEGAVHGDLGVDYVQKQPVTDLIGGRIEVTAGLVVLSMLISILIAIPIGILSALKANTWIDHFFSVFMLIATSIPGFMAAMDLLIILAQVMPGYQTVGNYETFGEYLSRLIAPSCCLALGNVALIGRVTRNAMVEQMKSDYMLTCQAKGIKRSTMIWKHAFHNSVIPVFTITAMLAGTVVGASVLVEQIFSLPGLGNLLSTAVLKSNYPLVQALTLIMLIMFQLIAMISDLMYTIVDPRIKL